MQYFRATYIKNQFIVYLRFKFNWATCLLPGNPILRGGKNEIEIALFISSQKTRRYSV